jgi:predicted LPLAT superfamily acyltransferase
MNGKKIACVLLMAIVAVFAYGGQMMHMRAAAKSAEADAAENDATSAQGALSVAQIMVEKARTEGDEIIRFLGVWRPYAERYQTQTDIETAVQASLRGTGLLVLSQKFEPREVRDSKNPLIKRVIQASLTIEDDYAKAINWIGEVERRIPLTRITGCELTGGETSRLVHAEVKLEIPVVDLTAIDKADPKAKKS